MLKYLQYKEIWGVDIINNSVRKYSVCIFIVYLLFGIQLSGCSWVNAAGRAYEGAGDGLEKATNETKPGFSKKVFNVGGKISTLIGGFLVDVSNHNKNGTTEAQKLKKSKLILVRVQKKLNKQNYDVGRADGVYGSKTKKAIESFQRDNGLSVNGVLDPATLEALKVE